jgi:tripartite-type tricarboxylate transporter receptor subunit TctC
VASDRKSTFFPEAPTLRRAGHQERDLDIWFGVWAPNNLPGRGHERLLDREIAQAVARPALKERYNSLGRSPLPRCRRVPQAAGRRGQDAVGS